MPSCANASISWNRASSIRKDLDACVSWGIGYKLAVVGPMALLDMAGLDIYAAVASYLNKELSNRTDVAGYVTERTAQRKLGIKTGGGIYDYTPEKIAELQSLRAREAGGGAQGARGMTRSPKLRRCAALVAGGLHGCSVAALSRRPRSSRRSRS